MLNIYHIGNWTEKYIDAIKKCYGVGVEIIKINIMNLRDE